MFATRLALVDRIRRVELALAREAYASAATALIRGRTHELGNAIQIVRLASLEIERRNGIEILELVGDLRRAAEQAATVLTDLLAAARPESRTAAGAPVVAGVRAAIERVRPAVAVPISLRVELADHATTMLTSDELDAVVIAAVLDASDATRLELRIRERRLEGTPWVELIRIDNRPLADTDYEVAFDRFATPGPGLHVVAALAAEGGGAATLSPGRDGVELVVALPQSSSS